MHVALLVIDVQRAFFSAVPPPARAAEIIANINILSARARARNIPVIFIQHEEADEEPRFGSNAWHLDDRVETRHDDLRVRKSTPDAFHKTELHGLLTSWHVGHVVICGYASEFCVDTTVRRAAALGFNVTVVSDAHTTEDKPHLKAELIVKHHNVTLAEIASFGVAVVAKRASSIWPE